MSYFDDLISKNKLGISDSFKFEKISRAYTSLRMREIERGCVKGNFDYQHLKDIHKHLFQDVFDWAGKTRDELGLNGNFIKLGQHFVPGNKLQEFSKIIFDELKSENYLKDAKDLNHFAKGLAKFMGELNALHPFREGNGRTQRIFLNDLAKNAGYKLDLNLIPKDKMITASIDASNLKLGKLEALIKANLKSFRQNLDLPQNQGFSF